jgi:hypothetical protein
VEDFHRHYNLLQMKHLPPKRALHLTSNHATSDVVLSL